MYTAAQEIQLPIIRDNVEQCDISEADFFSSKPNKNKQRDSDQGGWKEIYSNNKKAALTSCIYPKLTFGLQFQKASLA